MLFDDPDRPANGVRDGKRAGISAAHFWILNLPRYQQRRPTFPGRRGVDLGDTAVPHQPTTLLLSDTIAITRRTLGFLGVPRPEPRHDETLGPDTGWKIQNPLRGRIAERGQAVTTEPGWKRQVSVSVPQLSEACHSGSEWQKISRGRPVSHIAISVVDMCVCIYLVRIRPALSLSSTPIHVISS